MSSNLLLGTTGESPLVSVIIPVFNGAAFLKESIESALNQTYKHLEILVVDDGSTDGNASRSIAERFPGRVQYIRQQNAGTAAARNTGLREAKGDLIALLDQDDLWLAQKVETQVRCFLENENVGLCHTGGRVFDSESGKTSSEYYARREVDVHDILAWCEVACATTMFPRRVVDELGGFDESVPGVDDWDLWIRIAAARYRILGCPPVLSEIRLHKNNQGKNIEALYQTARRVIDKNAAPHPGCTACLRSERRARATLRSDYYVKNCELARRAARDGQIGRALYYRTKALARNPIAVTYAPARLLSRLGSGADTRNNKVLAADEKG